MIARLSRLPELTMLSIISVVELEGGLVAESQGMATRRLALNRLYANLEALAFGDREAAAYRNIITELGFSRRLIIDRMIAAQAIAAGLALATLNPRDFRDVPGLTVEDWSE